MARRLLVLANETVASPRVVEEVLRRADADAEVLVVAPVLHRGRVDHFLTSGEDEARAQAQSRLERTTGALAEAGIAVRGELGDATPHQALDDAVRHFGPDEVILVTHPPHRSLWLERGLVERARSAQPVPITHMVVDLEADRATVHADPRRTDGPGIPRVRVFHSAPYDEALRIRERGFRAVADRGMVAVTTAPPDGDTGVVFAVDLPAEVLGDDTGEGAAVRVPADVLDRHGPAVETEDAYVE